MEPTKHSLLTFFAAYSKHRQYLGLKIMPMSVLLLLLKKESLPSFLLHGLDFSDWLLTKRRETADGVPLEIRIVREAMPCGV